MVQQFTTVNAWHEKVIRAPTLSRHTLQWLDQLALAAPGPLILINMNNSGFSNNKKKAYACKKTH